MGSIMSRWLNHTVWKILIITVMAVISLLRHEQDGLVGVVDYCMYIFIIRIPKWHFLVSRCVVWAINHQYWFRRSTCGRAPEKGGAKMNNAFLMDRSAIFHVLCREVSRQPIIAQISEYRLTIPTLLPVRNFVTIDSCICYRLLSKNACFLWERWLSLQQLALACSRDVHRSQCVHSANQNWQL